MGYPILWDTERVREVLTTESRQKARSLFLQTHRPFKRIRLDISREDGAAGTFIDEAHLRSLIERGRLADNNRLFLVVGEAGSGKSELCQWLEYTVDPERSLAVHIPRSMTSAAHVVALLRERLGGDGLTGLTHTPLKTQAEYISLSAVVLLYEYGNSIGNIERWADVLRSKGTRQAVLSHLQFAVQGDTNHQLLHTDAEIDELFGSTHIQIEGAQSADRAQIFRQLLHRAMEQTLWLGDVRALLASLSDRAVAGGRRPLLLLEDVTAFQLMGDRLLDHLLDLTSGHFDAVIGTTTGYERTRLAATTLAGDLTHVHHRLVARCTLTDDDGRAYGFEDDLIEFARGYLRAVKPAHVSSADIPFGDDLYPFTETALRRALLALHEEGNPRQTPRLFLQHVLGAVLLGDDIPPRILDRSAYLKRPALLARADEVPDASMQSSMRWYGEITDRSISLDRAIAKAFSLETESGLYHVDQIRVDRVFAPQAAAQTTDAEVWQTDLRELQRWLSEGGIYPSRETLKQGIERVLLSLGDPRILGSQRCTSLNRSDIVYARGDERLPIVLGRASGDQPSTDAYVKVEVAGTLEERGILEELAYLRLSGAELADVSHNLALTLEWAQEHWDAYHDSIRSLLTRRLLGVSPESLIWTTWQMLCFLAGNLWSSVPPTRLREENGIDYNTYSPWDANTHVGCHQAGKALMDWREPVRRLFIGSFALRDTFLDRERIAALQSEPDILQKLAELPVRSLQTLPFKIRPGGHNLYALLAVVQRYAQALQKIDVHTALQNELRDLQIREQHLTAQTSMDMALLKTQLVELRSRCGEVGVAWQTEWDEQLGVLMQLLVEDIIAMLSECRDLEANIKEQTDGDVWSYQRIRHSTRAIRTHSYWQAVATVSRIQEALSQAARKKYRRGGRLLVNTRVYRGLVADMRKIWEATNA